MNPMEGSGGDTEEGEEEEEGDGARRLEKVVCWGVGSNGGIQWGLHLSQVVEDGQKGRDGVGGKIGRWM